MIRYFVTVTGDIAPYTFRVVRKDDDHTQVSQVGHGSAEGIQDAMFQANEMAHEAERKRRYQATTRTEELFSVPGDEKPQELVPNYIDFVD